MMMIKVRYMKVLRSELQYPFPTTMLTGSYDVRLPSASAAKIGVPGRRSRVRADEQCDVRTEVVTVRECLRGGTESREPMPYVLCHERDEVLEDGTLVRRERLQGVGRAHCQVVDLVGPLVVLTVVMNPVMHADRISGSSGFVVEGA